MYLIFSGREYHQMQKPQNDTYLTLLRDIVYGKGLSLPMQLIILEILAQDPPGVEVLFAKNAKFGLLQVFQNCVKVSKVLIASQL